MFRPCRAAPVSGLLRAELGLAAAPQASTYAPLFSLGNAPSSGAVAPAALTGREEVLLRLTRCASFADTHQYLDCYYAAVQPLRAELGLAPAPQASTYAALFSLVQMAPRTAMVAPGAPPPVPDVRANLVPQGAYTAATVRSLTPPRIQGDTGATHLPFLGAILGIRSVRVPPEEYGLPTAKPKPGAVNVDHIADRIAKVVIDEHTGSFTVTLGNGQVWKQVMNDDNRQHWRKDMAGTIATVSYGAGQTFNLDVHDGSLYKVERVS